MKVLLKVPSYIANENLNDHQLVFFSFLLQIERYLGIDSYKYEYIFNVQDFRKIIQCNAQPYGNEPQMLKILEYINISSYNELNWGISFKPELVELANRGPNTDMIKEEHVKISDPVAIAHHHYLLGRLVNIASLINDSGDLFYHKSKKEARSSSSKFQFIRNDER